MSTLNCWKCHGSKIKLLYKSNEPYKACPTCKGVGHIAKSLKQKRSHKHLFPTWIPCGPAPFYETLQKEEQTVFASHSDHHEWVFAEEKKETIQLCALVGKWKIFQYCNSHRYSTDDIVTAWLAWRVSHLISVADPSVSSLSTLDLGCGIGSVLLMTSWLHPNSVNIGIETQDNRFKLCKENISYNVHDTSKVQVYHSDLRNESIPLPVKKFNLITGTPPYFPQTHGALPSNAEESARCLFEFNGGIEAYCTAATKYLSDYGLFVVVETSQEVRRTYKAASDSELDILCRFDVIPVVGKPSLINVYVMCKKQATDTYKPLMNIDLFQENAKKSVYENPNPIPEKVDLESSNVTKQSDEVTPTSKKQKKQQPIRSEVGAIHDELVFSKTVRNSDGTRTYEYKCLLRDLGKPG
jgi:tRNA1Val (adenine37-N6)-methyltransferase